MGIDDIKPLGGPSPFPENAEAALDSPRENSFAESHGTPLADSAPSSPPLFADLTQFNRASLEDPNKVDSLVHSSALALVEGNQKITGELSPAEKNSLTEFFSSDPILRQQIETYLRKVLV